MISIDKSYLDKASDTVPIFSKISVPLYWTALVLTIVSLMYHQVVKPQWAYEEIFKINGFTLIIWATVLFFSATVGQYALNYLKGFQYQKQFSLLSFGFTLSVMLLVMSNHVVLLLFSWLSMGFFMSRLIGIQQDWGEARASMRFSFTHFIIGFMVLVAGIMILCFDSNQFTLSGLMNTTTYSRVSLFAATLCIIIAAIIQSALYPFHRWLLSAMTAPTPASALMHAGFVNGSGILLTQFAPVLVLSQSLWILFIIGGITAIVAQFHKLIQVNVKHKLACSTIAQMGFMIMQCGLGFFNAAIAHLILHGFYKAYLFLSSGEQVNQSLPKEYPNLKINPLQSLTVGLFGISGAILFAYLTGKTNFNESSVFLTLIVAITVGQATYNIVKEKSLAIGQKIILSMSLFIIGITLYAIFFNGITQVMQSMPFIQTPQPLHAVQIIFGVIFFIGFFIMKLGWHQQFPWLYVKLLNLSQPYKNTIHYYKKLNS